MPAADPNIGFHAISLECRIKINRSCKPANPAFTMSKIREDAQMREARTCMSSKLIVSAVRVAVSFDRAGGARRDRTDDLMLAKHALSQLSYGPVVTRIRWWARDELNVRPHAYQACALTT